MVPVAGVHGELASIPAELNQQSSRNNQLLLEAVAVRVKSRTGHVRCKAFVETPCSGSLAGGEHGGLWILAGSAAYEPLQRMINLLRD